uniref:HD domain-containing protein n=1 Tax=Pundamilia nyererei TaxID=303518 RepID=A0A3B4H8V7_9CICH
MYPENNITDLRQLIPDQKLHCLCDTPQFQRLRNIKQLGGIYFVYPGASHNRFEHSIGVAHLAGELAKALKVKQLEQINDQDVLCVQIAGLCHDLGHGPFSHFFDGMFMDEIKRVKKGKHEKASIEMFKHLLVQNGLKEVMKKYGLKVDEDGTDLVFIEEMIEKPQDKKPQNDKSVSNWLYKGREEKKSFLYEIVSNKKTGIDVDKFDYLARDCHHLGIPNSFDHQRFVMFARVCDVEEDRKKTKHICSRDKESANLYDIFQQRLSIHRRACQHKIKMAVEIMLKDALILVDDHPDFKIKSSKGEMLNISRANGDMEAYTKLTGSGFNLYLEKAREILKRVMKRELYRCVGQAKEVTLDYGMENVDPISKAYFYRKDNPDKGEPIPKSDVRTTALISIYEQIKTKEEKFKKVFNDWCKENGYKVLLYL